MKAYNRHVFATRAVQTFL